MSEGRADPSDTEKSSAEATDLSISGLPVDVTSPRWTSIFGVVGLLVMIGSVLGMLVASRPARPLVGCVGLLALGLLAFIWTRGPALLREYRRSRAIGAAPALVSYAILQLQLNPTMEEAADFASEAVEGRLGTSLETHRRGRATGRDAFESFAADWADLDPSLERAVSQMAVAVDTPPEDRSKILDRALDTTLEGARDRIATFAADIRGPVMGIYAFGVMLPLALVGMLPVLSATGGGFPMVLLAIGYDLVIPVGLLAAGVWLAIRRPAVADPSGRREMIEGTSPTKPMVVGLAVALPGFVLAPVFLPEWSRWTLACGTGVGASLYAFFAPLREEQQAIEEIEAELPDAVSIVGQSLAEGEPIERAVGTVGERAPGEIGTLFERAATRQRRLGQSVLEAFHGDVGVLRTVPSRRVSTTISLITEAARHGRPAGRTLHAVADYLDALDRVEREARRELAQTTSTLRQIAMIFAPAIAGVTVALATGMDGVDAPGKPVSVAMLGQVIGWYVVLLAVVLPSLSVVVERGFEPIRMGYRTGLALVTGVTVYPVTFLAARSLVYA